MGEPQLSREAKEYRKNILKRIAAKSSEDVTLVLKAISIESKKDNGISVQKHTTEGVTIDKIIVRTMLSEATIRRQLDKLEFAELIRRKKIDRTWLYTITVEGEEAINFMDDEEIFPDRRAKINAILNATKRQGVVTY